MTIALLQINTVVGDIEGNTEKILKAHLEATARGARLCVTPELAITGYPPLDLLYRPSFIRRAEQALQKLATACASTALLVGTVVTADKLSGRTLHNAAAFINNGRVQAFFKKRLLPTYDVFEEDIYFEPGHEPAYFTLDGELIGVTICEDAWNDKHFWPRPRYECDPLSDLAERGCQTIINLSASPWHVGKANLRRQMLQAAAQRHSAHVLLCNLVGGNDELIFDGNSFHCDSAGRIRCGAAAFQEDILICETTRQPELNQNIPQEDEKDIFAALVLGTRDYVKKCGFSDVLIGLSGGIDSAVTAAIACEALGPQHVRGVALPSRFSSESSIRDARELACNLGIRFDVIPIEPGFQAVLDQLAPTFAGKPWDVTEENIQSRLRGLTLMALSNKTGAMLLTTGNKSELAVGYCTIYGDMCGGLAVISDVLKTQVYKLAHWINRQREIIPRSSISKPPSAELRPNQTDQDSLPPYDVLDAILQPHIEQHLCASEIIRKNIAPEDTVRRIIALVEKAEYKRRQAAPGLRITPRAFGRGWRMPIAKK